MAKKLIINCGDAIILNYRPESFEGYDSISMNCGNMAMSAAAEAGLAQKRLMLNAGETRVLEVNAPVLDLGEGGELDTATEYAGHFLVADGDILVTEQAAPLLAGIDGLYTPGALYYPQGMDLAALGRLYVGSRKAYPAGAVVRLGDVELDATLVEALPDGTLLWVSGRLTALDEATLQAAEKRGIIFQAARARCYESRARGGEGLLAAGALEVVPDGYAVVQGGGSLASLLAAYGEKLYVQGNLTLRPADLPALQALAGLVVEHKLTLPLEGAAAFRAIGKAGGIEVYEGTLWQVNGKETVDHQQLQAAAQAGIAYTFQVNGMLTIENDVTVEDMDCILSLSYNGVVKVPGALKPLLAAKTVSANGRMSTGEDEGENRLEKAILGEDEDTTVINIGTYRML